MSPGVPYGAGPHSYCQNDAAKFFWEAKGTPHSPLPRKHPSDGGDPGIGGDGGGGDGLGGAGVGGGSGLGGEPQQQPQQQDPSSTPHPEVAQPQSQSQPERPEQCIAARLLLWLTTATTSVETSHAAFCERIICSAQVGPRRGRSGTQGVK